MTKHILSSRGDRDERAREDAVLRRILQAAAAAPDELPAPSPFLMTRLRAEIAAAGTSAPVSIGRLAWHALPALAVLVVVLSGWAGIETARAAEAREDSVARLLGGESAGGEAVLATLVLAGGAQ